MYHQASLAIDDPRSILPETLIQIRVYYVALLKYNTSLLRVLSNAHRFVASRMLVSLHGVIALPFLREEKKGTGDLDGASRGAHLSARNVHGFDYSVMFIS